MLEKSNGKGLYKLFGNLYIGNQCIMKTDYNIFQRKNTFFPLSGY